MAKRKVRRKAPAKPRKPSKRQLVAQARSQRRTKLKAWSKQVRTRDGFKCLVCGNPNNTQAHHVLAKYHFKAVQFELSNGVTLCPLHHRWGRYSAECNGLWFGEWLRANRPEQWQWAMSIITSEYGDFSAKKESENNSQK